MQELVGLVALSVGLPSTAKHAHKYHLQKVSEGVREGAQ